MEESVRRCEACCICGAPKDAPWHIGGAMHEFSFAYVPCDVRLIGKPETGYRHDGPCRGVEHLPSVETPVAANA